ncbi:hypothetical protein WK59_01470 [Burkholderia ubonensis]|uniref:GDSL-type esterase/lipase family protein n=1 Tax=Burkholderia ubonensis TaxID=101571 RepID=UPI00076D8723|nr:GDSL-type esterase/lipase family protein [Burkholderia ubonensis]KVT83075.1 hypothetical protein WK59_01470 [Burkholderia ubonensis]
MPFPLNFPPQLGDRTICQRLRISAGGRRIRLVFSNEYGTQALALGPVGVGHRASDQALLPVTFDGQSQAAIPPGGTLTSDPVALDLPALAELSVRSYLPTSTPIRTFHWDARHTSRLLLGNQVHTRMDANDGDAATARLLLHAVLVDADASARAVAVIGDSLVDGNGVAVDTYGRWTDYLAERLAPHRVAVINAGQSGSRLMSDGMGIATLARFERDVLDMPGVGAGIVQVGLNDLGWPGTLLEPQAVLPAAQTLIDAYRRLLALAAKRGMPLLGVTLTPFSGAFAGTPFEPFHSAAKDEVRRQVNDWIRSSGEFVAVIDLDALLRAPDDGRCLRADVDVGDRLHPGDEGNRVIAGAVPVELLVRLVGA